MRAGNHYGETGGLRGRAIRIERAERGGDLEQAYITVAAREIVFDAMNEARQDRAPQPALRGGERKLQRNIAFGFRSEPRGTRLEQAPAREASAELILENRERVIRHDARPERPRLDRE